MISKLFGTDKFLDLLGTPTFWYTVIILVGVIAFLLACLKNPKVGKWVLLAIFIVAWIAVTAYSGIQLNYYYNATGGIYGTITGIFDTNKVEIEDNLVFNFDNIELTESSNGDYIASIIINEILSVGSDKVGVYVNEMPCTYVDNNSDYVVAKYTYSFLDNDMSILCTDTLTMYFAFYENSTQLTISTSGGSKAVNYWNYYFNKNDFKVRIGERDYETSSDIDFGQGDISNYPVITFVYNDEILYSQILTKNSSIEFPQVPDGVTLLGWSKDKVNIFDFENAVITENTTFYAITEINSSFIKNINDIVYIQEDGDVPIANIEIYDSSDYLVESIVVKYKTIKVNGEIIDISDSNIQSTYYLADNIKMSDAPDFSSLLGTGYIVYTKINTISYGHYSLQLNDKGFEVGKSIQINSIEVTFNFRENGNFKVTTIVDGEEALYEVAPGYTVDIPDPVKPGYQFIGWYLDSNFVSKFELDTEVYRDYYLYAKFEANVLNFDLSDLEYSIDNTTDDYYGGYYCPDKIGHGDEVYAVYDMSEYADLSIVGLSIKSSNSAYDELITNIDCSGELSRVGFIAYGPSEVEDQYYDAYLHVYAGENKLYLIIEYGVLKKLHVQLQYVDN